jgi:hypothetical protein
MRLWVCRCAILGALLLAGSAHAAGAPSCTRQAARAAIPHTALGHRFVSSLHGAPWAIGKLICRPLMGGHATDMVALAECCTAASPTPLFIFRPTVGRWRLTYSSNLTTVVDTLKAQGRSLIEARPVYKPSDPLCCPSSHSHWQIRWNGHRWVVRRL